MYYFYVKVYSFNSVIFFPLCQHLNRECRPKLNYSWRTYLHEHSAKESENDKDEIVRSESVCDADNDQGPLTEEKHGFTTKYV